MKSLKDDPALQQSGFEDVKNDPQLGALFNGYLRSLDTSARLDADNLLRKQTQERRLNAAESDRAKALFVGFNQRLGAGEAALANLQDRDINQLEKVLKGNLPPTMAKEGLSLYIKGLAVHAPNQFREVESEIRKWKEAARDKHDERVSAQRRERLDQVADQMGISKGELNRFIGMENTAERRREIFTALGGHMDASGIFAKPLNFALRELRGLSGSITPQFVRNLAWPTDRLNKMIMNYRDATSGVRGRLGEVVQALDAINTDPDISDDELWKEIPDLLQKQSQEHAPNTGPMTLEEVRNETSLESVDGLLRKKLQAVPGAEAQYDFQRKLANPANMDAFWNQTLPGDPRTYGDLLRQTTSEIQSGIKQRTLWSSFIELLNTFLANPFDNAKKNLAAYEKKK